MSGRIKSKVVNATLANKDILDMFQGVLGGSGSSALPITHQKYLRLRGHVERFIRLLSALGASSLLTTHFPDVQAHVTAYIAALQGQFAASFSAPDFAEWLPTLSGVAAAAGPTADDYSRVPAAAVAAFEKVFAAVKTCSLVNTALVTCKNLIAHKKALSDPADLRDKFLARDAGMTFAPLPDLPQLNFKRIYNESAINAGDRNFLMVVLHKFLTISHDVYEALSAPDVDVEEFVQVIMGSIDSVKKQIPRCDQAFAKIVESVGLLRGNFGSYYKDYAASGNASIMMENFVLDVSKNTNTSPQVTGQFRRIISHYRKLASQQASNPKLQSLFSQVDANFKELEKVTGAPAAESASGPTTEEIAAEIAAADAAAEAPPATVNSKNAARNKSKRARAKNRKAAATDSSAAEPEEPAAELEEPADEPEEPAAEPEEPVVSGK